MPVFQQIALMSIKDRVMLAIKGTREARLILVRDPNRIVAAAVSHEVRNLCRASSMLSSHLEEKLGLENDEDFQGLVHLIKGLDQIAGVELHSRVNDRLEESIDTLKSIVEAERLKRSQAALTSKDEQVIAVAEHALRRNMLHQVESILATFDVPRFPTVTE